MVREIYFEAIQSGDQRVFDAIRTAPVFLKVLPRETVLEGESAWHEKSNPALAKTIRDLQKAIDVLESTIADARTVILAESGQTKAIDVIAQLAGGDEEE